MESSQQKVQFRLFFVRLAAFSAPFLVVLAFVFICDPYNMLPSRDLVSQTRKEAVSPSFNEVLWKVNSYLRAPEETVLLGDSCVRALSPESISELTGIRTSNLALGGSTLDEISHTFWFVVKRRPPRRVILGLSFNQYQSLASPDRVDEALGLLDSTSLYLIHRDTLKATIYLCLYPYLEPPGKPQVDRDAFWRLQIQQSLPRLLRNYEYPAHHYKQLEEIATYCSKNEIELQLFVPPVHQDYQDKVLEMGLTQARERFLKDLASLAPVQDFSSRTELITQREDYDDPFHARARVREEVIRGLFQVTTE